MPPEQNSLESSTKTMNGSNDVAAAHHINNSHSRENDVPLLAACRHLLQPSGRIVGRDVASAILPLFPTFCSAIPTPSSTAYSNNSEPSRPALASIDGRAPLTHERIRDFCVRDFGPTLHSHGFGKGDRIALVLPNGSELALAIVATSHWASCVPLSANGATSELEADLLRCGATLVIGPYGGSDHITTAAPAPATDDNDKFNVMSTSDDDNNGGGGGRDWSVFKNVEQCADRLGIPFMGLVPSPGESGIFSLRPSSGSSTKKKKTTTSSFSTEPNTHADEVLVLFTSGTTGNKKLVPHNMGDMLTAAATIALSWDLSPSDVNCNLMPLFHVGGIVRQVFSPIFSGGCVICCPSFDPSIFWSLLSKRAFTWYYAAPTMHQLILQTGKLEGMISEVDGQCPLKLRMIANAAGGLLPSLAKEMLHVFDATVLPSYGMTECMPITSPPSTYRLDKTGTSGVAVGPELAILNTTTLVPLLPGEEGTICVRGEPCFRGYGKIATDDSDEATTPETFLEGGWFNTGDLGYMDEDGYLFITGRSKEVINRGGEIISPMEVEESVTAHPDIDSCAAFSAAHDVLQEVVGIVVVMKAGRPRIDLSTLHEFLGERLAAPKWPQCLVFMDSLPKSHTNKLLRVKLGARLQLPELSDDMNTTERTFEAICPPQGTALDVPIQASRVTLDARDIEGQLSSLLLQEGSDQRLVVVPHPKRACAFVCYLVKIDRMEAIKTAIQNMARYSVPTHFVLTDDAAITTNNLPQPTMADAVATILQDNKSSSGPVDLVVQGVKNLFTEMLDLDYLPGSDASFFHLGGSSMLASQLASKIRKLFEIACSGAEVFQHASSAEMAKLIKSRKRSNSTSGLTERTENTSGSSEDFLFTKSISDHGAPFPPNHIPPKNTFGAALFQLVPMFIVFPIWQVSRYLLFFYILLYSITNVPGDRDIFRFIWAYIAYHTIWITITPLIFVALKWMIIGRYKAGRYPIWGSYYLRWWFVDVMRKLFLRGIWGSNDVMLNAYYRMLGAKIGKGAHISLEADVAEFDLVEVGNGAAVEQSTLRGFGVDNGAMILGPVKVGNYASVGVKSIIAPYTSIPSHCHLGPVTSSYDTKAIEKSSWEKIPWSGSNNARVNRKCLPGPPMWMQFLIIGPITFFCNGFAQVPPLLVLFKMLEYKGNHQRFFRTLPDLIEWLMDPHRIRYYIGIRVARALFSPFFYMIAALLVKKLLIGKFKAGPRDTSDQWQLLRHSLSATLFSRKKIQNLTDLIGRHYECVSVFYRLLGAKVGKRVFWPGQQPIFSGEFDLLEIGDDVVFGSRSAIFFTTRDSCEKVILCAGSNVADNCVVLPGGIIGKNAVLGSNSLCPTGRYLPESSVWLGSKGCEPSCLERGVDIESTGPIMSSNVREAKLPMLGDASTLRPFGKAFYLGKASYHVWNLPSIITFTTIAKIFIVSFHAIPLLLGLHSAGVLLYGWRFEERKYKELSYSFHYLYFTLLGMFFFTNLIRVALWVVIELTAKWSFIGRRKEGRYNYDISSYGQRWEAYQTIAHIRKFSRLNFMDFFTGTPYMSAFFRWQGGTIGKNCCLYPSGADPFMTEPELVYMGDRCVIDCASIVCHLNTQGNFVLAKIVIENECTLRTGSRVQQGVHMEEGSQLLEKSLALTGEIIEANSVWQGGPASWWFQYDKEKEVEEEVFDESSKLLQGRPVYYDVNERQIKYQERQVYYNEVERQIMYT